MPYRKDLRDQIAALEAHQKLIRIKREINKDTELMPLVRWQFRGLPMEERKAFLFEKVVDSKGKRYPMPVLVGAHAGSREIYAISMDCAPDGIMEKWGAALSHPIAPVIVDKGPVQEEVHLGDNLLERDGLEEFPIPISTPGFDNAPYLSLVNWVTKDPDTGKANIGNYRAMIKSKTRTGMFAASGQHILAQWDKYRKIGKPLPAAIVIGASPIVGLVACTKSPYEVDEYSIVGGVAGEPLELVRCKTIDIEVPATAEIVIEGEIPTDTLEWDAPFGEFTGYMGSRAMCPYFNVTAITHRQDAIYAAFISQFPPSESSVLRGVAYEATLLKFLQKDCGMPVREVALHESSGSSAYCVIRMKKNHPAQAWQVLHAAASYSPPIRKFITVVDEDIDPRDADAVNWALSFRVQPHRDTRIVQGMVGWLDPSISSDETLTEYPIPSGTSALLIDATLKWDYPPVSLPKKEFMERARQIWEEEGLPKLRVKEPWHGYALGRWTEENEEEATLALSGEYSRTGEKLARQRKKI